MRLIESSYEILMEQDVLKSIEAAGRTCYKSEDKITEDSAAQFVEMIKGRGHGAMLEHGTVYLKDESWIGSSLEKYKHNQYSRYNDEYLDREVIEDGNDCYTEHKYGYYVTTNYRVLVENGWLDDLKYACKPTEHHARRISVRFICDRGVSHELVRHRVFSFAQESTRFCNYSKDKFGNELTFILPDWAADSDVLAAIGEDGHFNKTSYLSEDRGEPNVAEPFIRSLLCAETMYLDLTANGCKAQQARQVLPNALKTEIVMTGFLSDWKGVFKLRCAENAHPDMRKLMIPLEAEFKAKGWL